jgi:hypothetical protein
MTAATLMSEAQRREELTALARNWQGYGGTVRCLRLIDLVDPELLKDPALADLWDTFLGEIALLDGINGEPWAVEVGWADVNDELTCPDRTEAARDEMTMRVAGVLDVLTRGIR